MPVYFQVSYFPDTVIFSIFSMSVFFSTISFHKHIHITTIINHNHMFCIYALAMKAIAKETMEMANLLAEESSAAGAAAGGA